jgi:aspartate ammonia-lyase
MKKQNSYRIERDALGEMKVPARAYYGVQTCRAMENFRISGLKPRPVFVLATALVKYSAISANLSLGLIKGTKAKAMLKAANEIIDGRFHDQFVVDVFQAGAGTSHNMNFNEVIANRALELLGRKRGDYAHIHPNDHVNMSQSTNDTFPTAMRVAALLASRELTSSLSLLEGELLKKAREFRTVVKSGRTHLQDAVPVTLGQEFSGYASSIRSGRGRIEFALQGLKRIGLGATAVGTGLNAPPGYPGLALRALSKISGIRGLKPAPDLFEALSSMTDFSALSGALRCLSIDLIRIANDLRLLNSGPRTGLAEIKLRPAQPGSSIMPGKVNPVVAEMMDMVAFDVIGKDLAITMAVQAGQLELNVMGPVIIHNLLGAIEMLTAGISTFAERAVAGIKVDRERCRWYFENSIGLATALNQVVGYERAGKVAKEASCGNKTVIDAVREAGILTEAEIKKAFNPMKLTRLKK